MAKTSKALTEAQTENENLRKRLSGLAKRARTGAANAGMTTELLVGEGIALGAFAAVEWLQSWYGGELAVAGVPVAPVLGAAGMLGALWLGSRGMGMAGKAVLALSRGLLYSWVGARAREWSAGDPAVQGVPPYHAGALPSGMNGEIRGPGRGGVRWAGPASRVAR